MPQVYYSRQKRAFGKLMLGAFVIATLALPYKSDPTPLRLSVCIPAIFDDASSGLLFSCLKSIVHQTYTPFDIVIVISGCKRKLCDDYRGTYTALITGSKISLITFEETLSPGQARNIAASHALGDVLSFIDADDWMHPMRLRLLEEQFRTNHHLRILLHGRGDASHGQGMGSEKIIGKRQLCRNELITRHEHIWLDSSKYTIPVAHGHVTVHKRTFENFKFGNFVRGEDCLYVRTVLQYVCSRPLLDAKYIDMPLTAYLERRLREQS
jgi:glycosyltransferase involved in cell wall biosynthesis